jgi:hypothetical protein
MSSAFDDLGSDLTPDFDLLWFEIQTDACATYGCSNEAFISTTGCGLTMREGYAEISTWSRSAPCGGLNVVSWPHVDGGGCLRPCKAPVGSAAGECRNAKDSGAAGTRGYESDSCAEISIHHESKQTERPDGNQVEEISGDQRNRFLSSDRCESTSTGQPSTSPSTSTGHPYAWPREGLPIKCKFDVLI